MCVNSRNRWENWVNFAKRKKLGRYASLAAVIGTGIAVIAPHTFLLEKYKNTMYMYRHGLKKPLSAALQQLAEEELIKCPFIPDKLKKKVDVCSVYGFDTFNAGSVHLSHGAFVGLPHNFTYFTPADVDYVAIKVEGEGVKWTSPAGKKLMYSLILSEKAQRFAINRELFFISRYRLIDAILASSTLGATLYLISAINSRLRLANKPRSYIHQLAYGVIGTVGLMVWFACKDVIQIHYGNKADEETAKLGQDYVEGGIEFYSKLAERNAALHGLLESGGSYYTSKGNYNTIIRNRLMPLDRLDKLKNKLNQLNENATQNSVETNA